jgi:hypothetical protein
MGADLEGTMPGGINGFFAGRLLVRSIASSTNDAVRRMIARRVATSVSLNP